MKLTCVTCGREWGVSILHSQQNDYQCPKCDRARKSLTSDATRSKACKNKSM